MKDRNKKRAPFAKRIETALNEGIEYARGERELKTVLVPRTRTYTGPQIARLRKRSGYSQAQFANVLGVSVKTLQSWEQGVRNPSRATSRLLQVIDNPADFEPVLKKFEPRSA